MAVTYCQPERKIPMKKFPKDVLDYIMDVLQSTFFGEVVLIAQNGILIQVEHTEKLRVHPWQGAAKPEKWLQDKIKSIRSSIEKELASLYYGRLTIVVKQGNVTHFDRLEKQRFMDGDGI